MRNISYEEAQLFVKLSDFVLNQGDYFIFAEYEIIEKYEVGYKDIAKLREIGFLQSGDFVTSSFQTNPNSISKVNFGYANHFLQFTFKPSTIAVEIPVISLTQAGQEIYELIESKPNWDYIRDLLLFIKKSKPSTTLHYGKILEKNDNQVKYNAPLKEFHLDDIQK